jgi:diguanylate cyclase (GGDEF)-like protein/PAS domain S-box-containing protein
MRCDRPRQTPGRTGRDTFARSSTRLSKPIHIDHQLNNRVMLPADPMDVDPPSLATTVRGPSNAAATKTRAGMLTRARDAVRRFFRLYEPDDVLAARYRGRQIEAVLRFTPVAMAINVTNAIVVVVTAWSDGLRLFLVCWALAVTLAACMGLRGWLRTRCRSIETASPRTFRHASIQAALLAALWATLAIVLFPSPDDSLRLFVGLVTTGMICGGGFALSSVPGAATSYVAVLGTGSAIAVALSDMDHAPGIGIMLAAYSLIVIFSAWTTARNFVARLVAEMKADQQSEVIALLLRDFENHASDVLWELDRHGRFVHASKRLEACLHLTSAEALSKRAAQLLRHRLGRSPEERAAAWQRLRHVFLGRKPFRDEIIHLIGKGGAQSWSLSASPLYDSRGKPGGWRGVATEITARQMAVERMEWLAHHDTLTGLFNRAYVRSVLRERLTCATGTCFAVVCFDLDGFKKINDTLGHAAGDSYLQEFSRRLKGCLTIEDIASRTGGDEFALLLPDLCRPEDIAARLEALNALLAAPCRIAGQIVPMRTSMGIALAPKDGHDVDSLLGSADLALYAAKRDGGACWRFFDLSMSEQARRRTVLEMALRDAIADRQLHLAFQPQLMLSSGAICGFEALLRWRHPELGDISPAEFIPIAEATGQMEGIGNWVLDEACRQAATWPESISISINVSAVQLGTDSFLHHVRKSAAVIAPQRVEFEITESLLLECTDSAAAQLRELRAMGYRIALDDFGTGYSALTYLRTFSFDTLKIDQSFVRDMGKSDKACAIVDTLLAMSVALDMQTVAEGVETLSDFQTLSRKKCGIVQGYLVSRPLPPADVAGFLATWRGVTGVPAAADAHGRPRPKGIRNRIPIAM